MKRILKSFQPLAFIMLFVGMLLAGQAFFGGEPGGEVGQQLIQYRWQLVLMAALGLVGVVVNLVGKE